MVSAPEQQKTAPGPPRTLKWTQSSWRKKYMCLINIFLWYVTGMQWLGRKGRDRCLYIKQCTVEFVQQNRGYLIGHWEFGIICLIIFKLNFVIDGWGISDQNVLGWMSLDLIEENSILVQVMAWCRQATSHYPNQYWPSPMWPSGITRLQRLNEWNIPVDNCRPQTCNENWRFFVVI